MKKDRTMEEYEIKVYDLISTVKPCPFCGAPGELRQSTGYAGYFYYIGCTGCNGSAQSTTSKVDVFNPRDMEHIEALQAIRKAVYRWNRRANE